MMIGLISIYKKDIFDIKIVIYHQTMEVIIKYKYNNKYSLDKFF